MLRRPAIGVLLATSLLFSTAACGWPGGGGPGPQAVLELDGPISLHVQTGSPFTVNWGPYVTNTSAVADTAPADITWVAPPGVSISAVDDPAIPCDAPLGPGDECGLIMTFTGTLPTGIITGSISVAGGPGTQGDTETITISAT